VRNLASFLTTRFEKEQAIRNILKLPSPADRLQTQTQVRKSINRHTLDGKFARYHSNTIQYVRVA